MKNKVKRVLSLCLTIVMVMGLFPQLAHAADPVTLGSEAVGSIVTLQENGTPVDYIVVQQGKPSDMYDDSCDGTWLLRKDIVNYTYWSSGENDYANSSIHSYLNSTFFDHFDTETQNAIKQVKIPYCPGSGTSTTISSGSNGLSCKIFLLSLQEVGWEDTSPVDGVKLSYFMYGWEQSALDRRTAYHNGSNIEWWLRTPSVSDSSQAHFISRSGWASANGCFLYPWGVRPALILPSTLQVDENGAVITNTAPTAPGTIALPASVDGLSALSITWGESTDAENNLAGYTVERSVDGNAWTQVGQTSSPECIDYIQNTWGTVQYRIKAYDTAGLESDYQTSNTCTVVPSTASRIGDKPVGSIVTLQENGTPVDYIVVQQGKPSSIYDDSCSGTWLLRKNIVGMRQWNDGYTTSDYANSLIQDYLDNTFISRFNSDTKNVIKQVKIPYCSNSATVSLVNRGSLGMTCKIFLLSGYEVGIRYIDVPNMPSDGAKLSYFLSGGGGSAAGQRRARLESGVYADWWLRTPANSDSTDDYFIGAEGGVSCTLGTSTYGVRPALILPSAILASDDGSVTTKSTYNVEYYQQNVGDDGYTLQETDELQGNVGSVVTAANKTYTGFHENTSAPDRLASGTVAADGSLVLKLYYDWNTYTATFNSNGGNTVPSQNGIRYGGVVVEPISPSKTGYDFAGWYSDAGLSSPYSFSSPVTGELTLYANWSPRTDTPYRVEYYQQNVGDDGYTLYEAEDLQGTTDAMVTAAAKSYTGFHENTDTLDRLVSAPVAPDGSLVLKLYYDRDTYTVTFDANGGNTVPSQNGIRYGGAVVEPVAPGKTGYDFAGWYRDTGLSSPYSFSSPVTGDLTLYAKWSPRTDTPYRVEHYQQNLADDNYTLYETENLQGTTDAVVNAAAKSYDGFHENTDTFDRLASGSVTPDGSLLLKLYYDRDTYTVSFDGNGGDVEGDTVHATYGQTYGPLPTASRTDYQFAGWYTAADGGAGVTENSIVESGGDRTLYAQWVKENYAVVDGTLVDADGAPVPDANIIVKAGNVDYKNTTTDSEGRFTILNVKYGTYNLVAEKNGVTVTSVLEIQAEKVSQLVTLPQGKTNSVVDVLGSAPELVVGGLNTLFDHTEVYSGSDKTVVADGGTVELRMTVEAKDAASLGADGTQITAAVSGMDPIYLSVELTKNVISSDGQETATTLTELPQPLDIMIPMEEGTEGCRIFRVHNGETDEITETPNEYGEYFEVQGSSVIVHACRFSTYAIATPSNNSSSYSIQATAGPGGTVTPANDAVSSGESVTVKIIPDEGHQVGTVLVDGKSVDASETYTFSDVHRDHTLAATFLCPSEAYADLDTGSWYHTAVDVMISKGYMLGTSADRWTPDGIMTRAQMAEILARAKGADAAKPAETAFLDVDVNAWYAGSVAWAADNGVGMGYGEDLFGPNDTLTREELALMLYRFAGSPAGTGGNLSSFFDRSHVSAWAKDAVQWAVGAGLLQGDDHKLLRPQGECTRAEAAALLYRMLNENK